MCVLLWMCLVTKLHVSSSSSSESLFNAITWDDIDPPCFNSEILKKIYVHEKFMK